MQDNAMSDEVYSMPSTHSTASKMAGAGGAAATVAVGATVIGRRIGTTSRARQHAGTDNAH